MPPSMPDDSWDAQTPGPPKDDGPRHEEDRGHRGKPYPVTNDLAPVTRRREKPTLDRKEQGMPKGGVPCLATRMAELTEVGQRTRQEEAEEGGEEAEFREC